MGQVAFYYIFIFLTIFFGAISIAGLSVYIALKINKKGGKLRLIPIISTVLATFFTIVSLLVVYYCYSGFEEVKKNDGAITYAMRTDDFETAKRLLENGANPNVGFAGDFTPLMYACHNNNYEMAKLLIEKGARINVQDNLGRTPLMFALDPLSPEIDINVVKLLIEKGADKTLKNNDGETAFDILNDRLRMNNNSSELENEFQDLEKLLK